MKIMKKSICLCLVTLMIIASLSSCGTIFDKILGSNESETGSDVIDGPSSDSTTQPDSEETEIETDEYGQPVYNDTTEGLNYNGKQINFLIRNGAQYAREWCTETLSTNLDHKVYARNQAVQDALGVTINYMEQAEGADNRDFFQRVTNVGTAGMGGIDVVSAYAAYATNSTAMAFYVNWLDDVTLPYLNLDRAYWNQNFKNTAQAYGKLYVNVGDMNLSVYDRCMVVYFNKTLAEDFLKDMNGQPIDLYGIVNSGEWYYETFYGMIKGMYEDSNTNSIQDLDDFYGVTGILGSEASDAFLYSFGGSLTTTAADGTHALVTDSDHEKLVNIFDKMIEFWYSEDAAMPSDSYKNCDIFANGNTLFTVDVVYHHEEGFRKFQEMEDGFGIIPMPKYDEDQDEYMTGIQDAHNVLSIMNCGGNQNFEMISAVLEKMASYSYTNVRPYYIENVLKKQNMDYDSAKCFNYVLNGIRWDFSDVYSISLSKLRESMWRTPFKTNTSFTNRWKTYESKFSTELSNLDTWLIAQK